MRNGRGTLSCGGNRSNWARSVQVVSVFLAGTLAGCSPSPYDVQVPPACISHNTAALNFSNESTTNTTYDVLMDGTKLTTVAPGATSDNFTVTALLLHVIRFNVTETSTMACPLEIVTPAQCSTTNHFCRG